MTRLNALVAVLAISALPSLVFAQTEPAAGADEAAAVPEAAAPEAPASAYDAEELSAQGFRPATAGGDEHTIPGGRLMLAAYVVFFGLLGWYTFQLTRRHSAVQAELAGLRKQMEDIDDRLDEFEGKRK